MKHLETKSFKTAKKLNLMLYIFYARHFGFFLHEKIPTRSTVSISKFNLTLQNPNKIKVKTCKTAFLTKMIVSKQFLIS